ncbi:hypothetical protein E2C01_062348 [Portunus trituberculatus]|uniref:Uncharacterized protein n=1 Tax=Portunus trituberculatus TaxID=210409 RepID=A0A5B7H673_PORTR|nr:hypothetical protein [Portunus trituberculatus]
MPQQREEIRCRHSKGNTAGFLKGHEGETVNSPLFQAQYLLPVAFNISCKCLAVRNSKGNKYKLFPRATRRSDSCNTLCTPPAATGAMQRCQMQAISKERRYKCDPQILDNSSFSLIQSSATR